MVTEHFTVEQYDDIVDIIRSRTDIQPGIGLILGSGLGGLADEIKQPTAIPYSELPHWPTSTVQGHHGRLIIGSFAGKPILVMQGRAHYYEGYSINQVGLPVRVMQRLGITTLIVTNAAGSVNPNFAPGDLMLITDHLNLMGMAGLSPLRGPNLDEIGPRFPDMSQAYDREYAAIARRVAAEEGIALQEGVYVGLAGPSFETPADLRFLRLVGADAVGMSTVPEVTVARHGGMRVLGISGISNKANLDGNTVTTHDEVLDAGLKIAPKLSNLLRKIITHI